MLGGSFQAQETRHCEGIAPPPTASAGLLIPTNEYVPTGMKLKRIRSALAAMSDDELRALRDASGQPSDIAPGLFAWLEHIASWETDRREGRSYLLRFPSEAMELEEVPDALDSLGALGVVFRGKGSTPAIDELLAAASQLVRGSEPLH